MKIRAISIQVGEEARLLEVRNDVLGDYFALTSGRYLDAVRHPSGATIYLNDDPVGNGLPVNASATEVLSAAGMLAEGESVYGGVVIVGGADDEGWDTDVDESLVRLLCADRASL